MAELIFLFFKKKKHILISLLFLLFSASAGVFSSLTKSYAFDCFASKLNNPNQHHYYNGFVPPFLKIKKYNDERVPSSKRYQDLLNYFYYNSFTGCCREVVDDEISVSLDERISIKLLTQNVFQIFDKKNDSGFYTVDMNMFYSYISPSDVKDIMINNYTIRNGCDTFIYINDKIADQLIRYYGIEHLNNPYLELIKNNDFSTISLNIGGSNKVIKACINSVLSSSHRFAVQTQKIYGDFALVFFSKAVQECVSSVSFDVDFKANQFGNKRIINDIKAFGYNSSNSLFEFYKYDYVQKKYSFNNYLSNAFLTIENDKYMPDYVFYIILASELIVFVCLYFKVIKTKKQSTFCIVFMYSLFIGYGFISNFINFFPLWTIFPLAASIAGTLLSLKEILGFENNMDKLKKNLEISI